MPANQDHPGKTPGNTATPQDDDRAGSGKVANDHNRQGDQPATQLNQGRRTPDSRHDRDSHLGSSNQTQSRKGGSGAG